MLEKEVVSAVEVSIGCNVCVEVEAAVWLSRKDLEIVVKIMWLLHRSLNVDRHLIQHILSMLVKPWGAVTWII